MVVLAFDAEDGAEQARNKLVELNNQYVLNLVDAVQVVRHADGKVKVKPLRSLTGVGAMGGAFWGLLFGVLFFAPVLGVAVGAASGAIAGHFSSYGLSKEFLKQIENALKPGTSALGILAANVTIDKVVSALSVLHPTVMRSSLSSDQEAKLREAFGEHK